MKNWDAIYLEQVHLVAADDVYAHTLFSSKPGEDWPLWLSSSQKGTGIATNNLKVTEEPMSEHTDPYQKNLLALGFIIRQGAARVRRTWYQTSTTNFITIENYNYDETGRLIKTVEDGQWFQCVYGYDAAGRIVRRTQSPVEPDDPNLPTIEDYFYDESGRITRQTVFHEQPDTESTFSFDAQGRISAAHKHHLTADDAAMTAEHFYYDEAGRLQIVEETFSRGAWAVSTYHYDPHDRLILIYKRDAYSITTVTSYEYVEETPTGEVIANQDFAIVRQPLESQATFSAYDFTALSEERRCLDGVDLGRELEDKLALHLRTGCYMGRYDAVGDWPERIVKSPALSPLIKRHLIDSLHRCLTHAEPIVRIAAVGVLDTSSVLRDNWQIVLRMVHHWPLFAGLRLPDDDPTRDRGLDALHMLAARANWQEQGSAFIKCMATDKTYGGSVLAALTHDSPDWVVKAITSLVTPELDPQGLRLAIILHNLEGDAERITRVIQTLRGKLPDARLHAAIAPFKNTALFDTLHALLQRPIEAPFTSTPVTDEITTLTHNIIAWLDEHGPDYARSPHNPGATQDELAALEATLGRPLPPELAALLHSVNGDLYIGEYNLLSTQGIADWWARHKCWLDDGTYAHLEAFDDERDIIKVAWWHPGLIPVLEDSGCNQLCLDLDPGPNGVVGQMVWWELYAGPYPHGADSLLALLRAHWKHLSSGKYDTPAAWEMADCRELTEEI